MVTELRWFGGKRGGREWWYGCGGVWIREEDAKSDFPTWGRFFFFGRYMFYARRISHTVTYPPKSTGVL